MSPLSTHADTSHVNAPTDALNAASFNAANGLPDPIATTGTPAPAILVASTSGQVLALSGSDQDDALQLPRYNHNLRSMLALANQPMRSTAVRTLELLKRYSEQWPPDENRVAIVRITPETHEWWTRAICHVPPLLLHAEWVCATTLVHNLYYAQSRKTLAGAVAQAAREAGITVHDPSAAVKPPSTPTRDHGLSLPSGTTRDAQGGGGRAAFVEELPIPDPYAAEQAALSPGMPPNPPPPHHHPGGRKATGDAVKGLSVSSLLNLQQADPLVGCVFDILHFGEAATVGSRWRRLKRLLRRKRLHH